MQAVKALIMAGMLGLAAGVRADLQQDVLTFTGNVHAKMVWVRCETTATDFSTGPSWYNNYGKQTTLMRYDSDAKAEAVLDATVSQHMDPMITKSGDYVIWNANDSKTSYIIKWDGTGRAPLITGSCYYVLCCQYDQAAKKEYLWTTDAALSPATNVEHPCYLKVWRVELVNGAANAANAQLMIDFTSLISEAKIWAPFTVSGDGKIGIINNHPNITVFEIATKKGTTLSLDGEGYGCWPSVAPDTSYRVTHFNEMHTYLHVFDKYNTTDPTKIRWVSIANEMPGNVCPGGCDDQDATCPRFSNHPRFLSAGYPLIDGVSLMNYHDGEFCIGKWSAGYDSTTWIRITATGDTHRDKVGDLWLANGEGPNKTTAVTPGNAAARLRPQFGASVDMRVITVSFAGPGDYHASIRNAQGRTVAVHGGSGAHDWTLATQSLTKGAYFLDVTSERVRSCERFVVCR